MFKKLIIMLVAIAAIYCTKSTTSPTSNNTGTGTYFVNWSANGQNYSASANDATVGTVAHNTLAIYAKANGGYPIMTIGIDTVTSTTTYSYSSTGTNHVGIVMQGSSDQLDVWSVAAPNATGSVTITDNSSGSVSGTFTAYIGKATINGTSVTYSYITVTGSFKVIRLI